jgi:hypothetical protein
MISPNCSANLRKSLSHRCALLGSRTHCTRYSCNRRSRLMAPSCRRILSELSSPRCSATLPFSTRKMVIPFSVTRLPVGGYLRRAPCASRVQTTESLPYHALRSCPRRRFWHQKTSRDRWNSLSSCPLSRQLTFQRVMIDKTGRSRFSRVLKSPESNTRKLRSTITRFLSSTDMSFRRRMLSRFDLCAASGDIRR